MATTRSNGAIEARCSYFSEEGHVKTNWVLTFPNAHLFVMMIGYSAKIAFSLFNQSVGGRSLGSLSDIWRTEFCVDFREDRIRCAFGDTEAVRDIERGAAGADHPQCSKLPLIEIEEVCRLV